VRQLSPSLDTLASACTRPAPPLHIDPQGCQVLGGGEVAEGLVGTDGVVDGLPVAEGGLERGEARLGVGELVELLGVGPVGPLDRAVELGAPGRQDEEADAPGGTRLLELGHELRAVVDADGPDLEGHPRRQGIEDLRRCRGRGSAAGLHDVPAAGPVPGGELLQDEGRELADIERVELDEVELDEIARARDRPVLRGPHGIGPTPGPLPDADPASDMRIQRSAI